VPNSSKVITYSFCDPFIGNLADFLEERYLRHSLDLSRLAVVFGGRRPMLFLNRALAKRLRRSFYPPRFFTIDEFVRYTVQKKDVFRTAQDLDQCYLLYRLARENIPQILKGRETFAQFLPWTREIIAFIDQMDLEDIDDNRLKGIRAHAEIGYDVPEDINRLLGHMVILRDAYHEEMKGQRLYSRGFQYWRAAQVMEGVDFAEFDQILFCNFFYFNRSEERIVQKLYGQGKATLIFQGDERRWPVLQKIAKDFSCMICEGESPRTPSFRLRLYKAFDVHSQVGVVGEILKGIKNCERTVIVLPVADHLVPLVSQIARYVRDFNVSMGYPLKRSSLYALCEFMFNAQLSRKAGRYYAKDYLKALRHPFIKNLQLSAGVPPAATRILIHKIEEILTGKIKTALSGSLFVQLDTIAASEDLYLSALEMIKHLGVDASRRDLRDALQQTHEFLFIRWEDVRTFEQFAAILGGFLDILTDKSFFKNYPLNLTIAERMYAVKDEFQSTSFRRENFSPEEIFKIFDSKISREMVAFHGSPLKGLQVLGLFETRSLNFENVIILDVQEGALPRLNVYEPLIPREVMISLNLDRLEIEEEIQRYQFMRLISSAKNVHLVYQEGKDKERSRFVEELIWEEQKRQGRLDVIPVTEVGFEVKVAPPKTVIRKTAQMIAFLRTMRYSASSINTYVRNPVEFYYSYVLGLKQQDDLLDEPDGRHVGTFIHELLEEAFKPFLRKRPRIDEAFRQRFVRMFDEKFDATLARSMSSDAFMLKAVMAERLNRFLDNEERDEERRIEEILYLESRFEDVVPLSCGDIRFSYVVDRIDRMKDGTHMIIDYKTGTTLRIPRGIDRIASMALSREALKDEVGSFQIPLYFYYLDKAFPDKPVNVALYNLRTLKLDKFIDEKMAFSRGEINMAFLRALDFVVSEILNPEVHFESDEPAITSQGQRR
jgi:hypothetical protein